MEHRSSFSALLRLPCQHLNENLQPIPFALFLKPENGGYFGAVGLLTVVEVFIDAPRECAEGSGDNPPPPLIPV